MDPATKTQVARRPPGPWNHHRWLLGLFALVIAWGGCMYSTQLTRGLTVTGLNRPVFWGTYVANFIFCVGMSAGGIAVSALVHLRNKENMKPLAVMAEVMATSFLVLAALFISMDLGQPTRFFFLFLHPHPRSPLFWDVVVISSYLLMCAALLYFSGRSELLRRCGDVHGWAVRLFTLGRLSLAPEAQAVDRRWLRRLAIVSIPAAVALHSVTAWILGLVKAQPGWNTPILAPLFIASALVSGVSAVILGAIAARRMFPIVIEEDAIKELARYLIVLVPILMYLLLSEFLTVALSGGPIELRVFQELLTGRFAGIFWFDTIVGILIPLVLLGMPRFRTLTGIGFACAFLIAGVFAERTYVLLPSLMRSSRFTNVSIAAYGPTQVEWGLMAGAYALGGVMFVLVMRFIFRRPAGSLVGRRAESRAAKPVSWTEPAMSPAMVMRAAAPMEGR